MADEPENVVLILLRKMDEKIDRLSADMKDMKVRMTNVDEGLAGVNRRLDRLEARVDRIERRLELSDTPH